MQLKEIIYQHTDGGLTILTALFPHFHEHESFKADDDEKTPSAKAKQEGEEWKVCVYDGSRAPSEGYHNAINWYMYKNGIADFVDAMKAICIEFNVPIENKAMGAKMEVIEEKREYTGFRTNIMIRPVTDEEAKSLGKYVTAHICETFQVSYVECYDYTDKQGVTRRTYSSEINPQFLLGLEGKIYAPKSSDARYRYMATRPMEDSRTTLWRAQNILNERRDESTDTHAPIVICCGYRDAINVYSLGYDVVWMSGEGLNLPKDTIKKLSKVGQLYYCADLDKTGQDQAHKACDRYLNIYRMYLPIWLLERKDHRGKACKDVTDYIKVSGNDIESCRSSFKVLLSNAAPYKFWYEWETDKGEIKMKISRTWIKRFLIAYGFRRYRFDDGKGYVQIQGNTLKKVDQDDIKSWVNHWAAERGFSRTIQDMISGTRDLSEMVLSELPDIDPKIQTAGADYQDLIFQECIWRITLNDIRVIRQGELDSFVWNHKIGQRETGQVISPKPKNDVFKPHLKRKLIVDPVNPNQKIQSPDLYFKINADGTDIEVLNPKPQWFQFLINTCKVYWRDEVSNWALKNNFDKPIGELQSMYSKTSHGITSEHLNDDQNTEQKCHLINRIYMLGYLMHRYKFRNNSLMVWCMDYKAENLKDSKGRSGKSIIPQAFEHLKTFSTENGRDHNLTKKNHLFADVTSLTDLLIINDVHSYLDLGFFFNYVTDNITVNPKNVAQRTIPFDQAGKLVVTSNFAPTLMDDSTLDRILFSLFSDWYHSSKDYGSEHRPVHDFGCQLFQDWDNAEWNEFLNFMSQCCMAYLNLPKIQAPMNQVMKRHNMREAGDTFIEWANETLLPVVNKPIFDCYRYYQEDPTLDGLLHFEPSVGTFIIRSNAKELFEKYNGGNKVNMNRFTRQIKSWCELQKLSVNPDHIAPSSGRVLKTVQKGDRKKQEECLFLFSGEVSNEEYQTLNNPPI